MELAIYIKELLYNNDILIIPGIGGFKTIYRAADINTDEHTITPPIKFLIFDKDLVNTDDFFVQQVALLKKATKKNAEKFVKHQTDAFNKKLNKGETVFLEGIGYFSKDQDLIRFERVNESNFLTDSYGLSKIDYKPLEITLPPQQFTSGKIQINKTSLISVLIFLGSIILIVGAIIVILNFKQIKSKFTSQQTISKITPAPKKVIVTPKVEKAKPDTSKESDLEKFFNNKTDKKTALAIDSVKEPVKPSEDKSYFIIGGSFKTFQRASILANQYQKNGLKAEVLQFGEDLYRVSLGEFGEKAQALSECERLKGIKGLQDIWLLSK